MIDTYSIRIKGKVQGIGFRPFIYTLATSLNLKGYVANSSFGVLIKIQASQKKLDNFIQLIHQNKPTLSNIESFNISQKKTNKKFENFKIKTSQKNKNHFTTICTDISMCKQCEQELTDKNNRRFNHPFISCSHCGPRYSIVKDLPYDRKNTSMDKFNMCKECQSEYEDPTNRRYHAQTISCNNCGPKIKSDDIQKAIKFIQKGKIVAVKSIGGYHLICDATNDKAVKALRQRKKRIDKPFAVMVKNVKTASKIATINSKEKEILTGIKKPIVLLKKKKESSIKISKYVAPKINQIGLLLPFTPLHHLISQKLDKPLVATSANISGEPICSTKKQISKLSNIYDFCLDHDRDIINSLDDSVVFIEDNKEFILRNARGYAPQYFKIPKSKKTILALGANQKSTVSLCIKDNLILSPYICDLNTIKSVKYFKSTIKRFTKIYNANPNIIVCDKHPNYESTNYAKELKKANPNIQLTQIQHHYAHVLAILGINNISNKVLAISFDGTGYGDDKNLWGGEFLVCDKQNYKRVGQFKYFKLLGGETAIKEPRRIALSFLFELYGEKALEMDNNNTIRYFSNLELHVLYDAWLQNVNTTHTSSAGRLFDGVASLLDILQFSNHEGESGLLLESLYNKKIKCSYKFSFKENQIDFSEVVKQILEEDDKNIAVSKFFNTIIEIIYYMYKKYDLPLVVSGGVFQNRILLKLLIKKIPNVILPENFMSNDSAISYGQIVALS